MSRHTRDRWNKFPEPLRSQIAPNRYRLQTARSRSLRNQLGQIRMLTASTVFEVYAGQKSFGRRSGLLLLPCRTNAGQSVF